MTKTTWFALFIGLLLVGGVVAVAQYDVFKQDDTTPIVETPTQPVVTVLPYGNVSLHVGETATFKNNSITLVRVTEDSRCAEGVTCVWAGTLKAQIESVTKTGTSTQIIELGKSMTTEAESVSLISATPYPKQGVSIARSAYVLTFDVSLRTQAATQGACYVGGCSSEVCSDKPGVASNCIYRAEFACYKTATCERQVSGTCGWTDTATLRACVANPPTL